MSDSDETGSIQSRTHGDVTVKTVLGKPSTRQFVEAVEDNYRGSPSSIIVWDLSQGSTDRISGDDLRNISRLVQQSAESRAGGKTALIAPGDLEFGMGRMLEALGDVAELPFEVRVFRTSSEAADWLEVDDWAGSDS